MINEIDKDGKRAINFLVFLELTAWELGPKEDLTASFRVSDRDEN